MPETNTIFKQKADYYDATLSVFNEYRSASYGTELELLKWLSDFAVFTLLGSYDLWIVVCDYNKSIKKYQQAYYSRQASLICFELLEDISQYFNSNFKELMLDKIHDKYVNEESKRLCKIFNKMKNDNESKFKAIRDFTVAHRHHDISKQIDIINNIDNEGIISFSLKYLKLIEELHILINYTIKYIGNDTITHSKVQFLEKYGFNNQK